MPFLVDSPSLEVKITGIRHAREIGLAERVVYNSLTGESTEEEFEAVKNSKADSAVLLAYKTGFMTVAERVKTVEHMLSRAEKAGVSKPLVDTFVLDLPSLGQASRSLLELKRRFGVPCGCGAHNAFATWKGLKEKMGSEALTPCAVTVSVLPIILGGDFVLYGPIELCAPMFASVNAVYMSYKFLRRMKESMEL
jgi:tetrahydromethanopterin S-methyltransferase subunit H